MATQQNRTDVLVDGAPPPKFRTQEILEAFKEIPLVSIPCPLGWLGRLSGRILKKTNSGL
jgi:hypothetical protein